VLLLLLRDLDNRCRMDLKQTVFPGHLPLLLQTVMAVRDNTRSSWSPIPAWLCSSLTPMQYQCILPKPR
jgi:hypothetical protein